MGFRLYEDSSFENEMINIDDFSKMLSNNASYEYFYFLSHLRHNLFNWYPFKEDGNILEIGSGYGQLTSLFTQKVNHVVAIEDTESKAKIISKRANNANVIVCDFDKLDIDEKFDYIVLCNTFEYSKSFYDSENPYTDYLSYLKTFLKEDGVILIALSNRLGLKYFAGFKEEHTNQFFTGVEGFSNNIDNVKTFTKQELIDIIKSSGFNNYKFFYPYPNHEFPFIINTDKFVNDLPFSKRNEYFDERIDFFSEDKLNQILARDNLAGYFSNSFLVEIRNSEKHYDSDEIDWVKLNLDRKEEFRSITTISNDNISKYNVLGNADYFKKLNKNIFFIFGKIKYYDCEIKDYSINYNLLKEKSLEDMLLQSIFNNNKNEFFRLISEFYDALFFNSFKSNDYLTDEFKSIFKIRSDKSFHFHTKSNLDLTFDNIYLINNDFFTTGYEWFFDFPIPLEYIFYRVINYHIQNNILFKEFTSIKEVFNYFNLDVSDISLFSQWDDEFFKYVYGKIDKPKCKILPKENIDYNEKFDEYLQVTYNSDNLNSNKSDKLKRDIVLNQRRIINEKNNEIKDKNKLINQKNKLIKRRNKEIKKIKKEYAGLLNSTSWKITKPLRKLLAMFKK